MKKNKTAYWMMLGILAVKSPLVLADQKSGTVLPQEMPSFSGGHPDIVPNSNGKPSLVFELGCYGGGNMRSNSEVRVDTANSELNNEAWFSLTSGKESKIYRITFPGSLIADGSANGGCAFSPGSGAGGTAVAVSANTASTLACSNRKISLQFSLDDFPGMNFDDTRIKAIGYYTNLSIYRSGYHNGGPGWLSLQGEKVNISGSMSAVIKADFAGIVRDGQEAGYLSGFWGDTSQCIGFYSPIMLFFDAKRPKFSGKSSFLKALAKVDTYWPEANSPGYFLAVDSQGDGSIKNLDQLFGQNTAFDDGFAALIAQDKNKDRKLDFKDEVFAKLLLWQDKNGDGVAQKEEIQKLSEMKVSSIDLKYDPAFREKFGGIPLKATGRGISTFNFKDKKGKAKKGSAIDIWFAPASVE